MTAERKASEYEQKIRALESALDQARQESELIQAQSRPGGASKPNVKLPTQARVDVVEHQALRQEVESLRKTVADLQQELDHTNDQARQAEDQLEDKNAMIEDLRRDIEGLQQSVNKTESHRRKAEEARLQSDTKLSVLQERMEAGLGPLPEKRGFSWVGLVLGGLLLFGILEGISFGTGRGELIGLLLSEPKQVQIAGSEASTSQSQSSQSQPAQTQTSEATTEPLALDITRPESAKASQALAVEKSAKPEPVAILVQDGGIEVEDPGLGYPLISLKAGTYQMGNRLGAIADEIPLHEVKIPPFLMGRNEVTFELYDRFAKATGRALPSDSGWGRGKQPVINVSWDDAQALARWLSEQTGKRYRLPTEAEWEYAASGGRDTLYWWGNEIGQGNDNCFNCMSAWDLKSPAPINSFAPNPFGLVNMAGNVQEWVADCYRSGYAEAPTDGSALELPGCTSRVVRGGAFNKSADSMKRTRRSSMHQDSRLNNLGIRLVREP